MTDRALHEITTTQWCDPCRHRCTEICRERCLAGMIAPIGLEVDCEANPERCEAPDCPHCGEERTGPHYTNSNDATESPD